MSNTLGSLLDEAKHVITGERQDRHGQAEDSFGLIAGFWSTYLGVEISKRDAAIMMALFKIARGRVQPRYRDNDRDAVGYVSIAADRLSPAREFERSCQTCVYADGERLPCAECHGFDRWSPRGPQAREIKPKPEQAKLAPEPKLKPTSLWTDG